MAGTRQSAPAVRDQMQRQMKRGAGVVMAAGSIGSSQSRSGPPPVQVTVTTWSRLKKVGLVLLTVTCCVSSAFGWTPLAASRASAEMAGETALLSFPFPLLLLFPL